MTAAVYVRTSTDSQDGEAQHHALEARAPAGAVWYVDRGISGAKASRPALDKLRAAARRGEVRELYVYALDRLGRSSVDVLLLVDDLARCGVRLHSLREGEIDPGSAIGRAILTILSGVAQLERDLIRERVQAGIRRAQDKGTRSGRPIGRPARDVPTADALRRRAAGESWRSIARALKVPAATLRRACSPTKT